MQQFIIKNNLLINFQYIHCDKSYSETILFAHGLGLDMSTWDDVVNLLKSDFNILKYDLREHGKSTIQKREEFTWDLLINDLDLLLNHLNINSFHFVGHSGGGNLGIELAKCKSSIKSLTLISTPIYFPKELGRKEIENRVARNKSNNIEDIVEPIINNICYPPTFDKAKRLMSIYKQISVEAYLDYTILLSKTILAYSLKEFKEITIPKLILVGEFDVLYPPQLQMMSMNYLTNCRFLTVQNSSNCVMIDQPITFVNYLNNFVSEIDNESETVNYTYTNLLKKELQSIVDSGINNNIEHSTLGINIIDNFKFLIEGKEIEGKWNQRKAKQILTYIIYHQSVTREQLYDTFWRDYDVNKAQNYLRVSLNHIKQIIEGSTGKDLDTYISIDREGISIKGRCSVDIKDLQVKISSLELEKNLKIKIPTALGIFKSLSETLFSGFYDDWIINLRAEIENRIISVCEELLEATINKEEQVELLKILIKYSPTDDVYYSKLFMLLDKIGNKKDIEIYKRKYQVIIETY